MMFLSGTVTTPADRARALASIRAAGDLGRELADLAVLMFGPMPDVLRPMFDESLSAFLPDMFADWHGMQDEDRDYLQGVTAMVFDRRLALHASASFRWGGEA